MDKNFVASVKNSFGGLKRDQKLTLVAVLCAFICVILCIACLISVKKATKGIENVVQEVVQEVQEMKSASAELSDRITQLEVTVGNTQTALNESTASRYINITKQPSSVSTYVGRTDAMLFSVEAEGSKLNFQWQKYENGAWVEIVFDSNSINETLGIRLYSETGKSELWTKELTKAAYGDYRCVLTDSIGTTVITDAVKITERSAG